MESCGELQHWNRRGNRQGNHHCDRQNPVIYLITLRRTQTNLWGAPAPVLPTPLKILLL